MLEQNVWIPAAAIAAIALFGIIIKLGLVAVKRSRAPIPIETVEFYPPPGMNPVEVSFVMDNDVSYDDVESLIYYWIDQKYLTIRFSGADNYTLRRIGAPDPADDAVEAEMFDALFAHGKDGAVSSDVIKSDYREIFSGLRRQYLKAEGIFEARIPTLGQVLGTIFSGRIRVRGKGALFVLVIMLLITAAVTLFYCCYWLFKATQSLLYNLRWEKLNVKNILKVPLFVLAVSGLLFVIFGIFLLFGDEAITLPFTVSMLVYGAAFSLLLSAAGVVTFNFEINALTLKLMGFRRFLKTAEVSRIDMLVDENPRYYLDTLPFAQVFGLTDKWVRNFRDGTLPASIGEALRREDAAAAAKTH